MSNEILLYYPRVDFHSGGAYDLHRFPYSLMALMRPLLEQGYGVRFIEGRMSPECAVMNDILAIKPLFIGISSLTGYQLVDALRVSNEIKKYDATIPIVWGGWHASLLPEDTLKEACIDVVCVGQGEETIVELAKAFKEGSSLSNVKGIYYKENGEIKKTELRSLNTKPSKLILDHFPINMYGPYIGYLTSYGCPWNCAFCAIASVYNRKWWFRELDEVMYDLHYLADNYTRSPIVQFDIDDDNFFIKKDRVLEFCKQWNNYKNIPIDVLAHLRLLERYSDEEWDLLRTSGIRNILIGAESGNLEILKRLHKSQTTEQILWFTKKCTEHDIVPQLSFLTGFPDGEEIGEFKDTILLLRDAHKLNPRMMFKLFWIRPYPGTELFYKFQEQGWPMPKTMKQWSDYTLRHAPIWVSREMAEMFNFYVNAFLAEYGWDYTWESFVGAFKIHRSANKLPPEIGI